MRSTTFDMVAMMLTAILVISTTGGILTWRYFRQPGGTDRTTRETRDVRSESRDETVVGGR